MKRLMIISSLMVGLALMAITTMAAQGQKSATSLGASVTQTLGLETSVTINYSRPGVKGRTVWGELVPMGLAPGNKYSNEKPYPWRAGANENTTFETSGDLMIEGKKLAAGKYGVHMIPGATEWVLIFSKKNEEWGSYSYDQANDALRVTVKPMEAPHCEWLTYGFENLTELPPRVICIGKKLKYPLQLPSQAP